MLPPLQVGYTRSIRLDRLRSKPPIPRSRPPWAGRIAPMTTNHYLQHSAVAIQYLFSTMKSIELRLAFLPTNWAGPHRTRPSALWPRTSLGPQTSITQQLSKDARGRDHSEAPRERDSAAPDLTTILGTLLGLTPEARDEINRIVFGG